VFQWGTPDLVALVQWWKREGWWRALITFEARLPDRPLFDVSWCLNAGFNGQVVCISSENHVWEGDAEHPSEAALAALEEAMEVEK